MDPPQSAYSFSSCWDGCSSGLTHAKENSDSAWCAQSNDGNQWTMVDLGKFKRVRLRWRCVTLCCRQGAVG